MTTSVLTDKLQFPESPRWHEGQLWCCDFSTQRVVRVDLQGQVETVLELSDTPTSIGWTPEGELLVVSAFAGRLLKQKQDALLEVANLSEVVAHPCNDMVVDKQGRAYIGNMGYDFGEPDASPQPAPILLVSPNGKVRIVAEGLAFPNGLVITPDGRTLIVAESHAARLTAFQIETDGSLSSRRVWAQFEDYGSFGSHPAQVVPDGMCLDAEGAVWFASPNTREVLRVREGATIVQRVALETIPLACTLGGLEGRTLFITTTESLNPMDTNAVGRIETLRVDVPNAESP